jgi:signal transduction histidine kinase
MQLFVILGCVLIAAQMVTLALTVLLPPAPTSRWNLEDVARALASDQPSKQLERRVMAGPPDLSKPGWLISETSRSALASRLQRADRDVVLAFYTQLPVGGVTIPVSEGHDALAKTSLLSVIIGEAKAQSAPGGPPPGGIPNGGFPGGGVPGGGFPGGQFPGGVPGGGLPGSGVPHGALPGDGVSQPPRGTAPVGQSRQSIPTQPRGGPSGAAIPRGSLTSGLPVTLAIPGGAPLAVASPVLLFPATALPVAPTAVPKQREVDTQPVAVAKGPVLPDAAPQTTGTPAIADAQREARPVEAALPQKTEPIPFRADSEGAGLLSLTTPPFIEGDFVAALRQKNGSWVAVAPRAEAFPNRWQQRVILWFILSLAIVAPLAWLFTRRIVRPLEGFARAAEILGRDPSATILPLSGPAEIGRAANAFNQMRNRLRAFVDDRTAMVGAISHDLRTPLTRLRFRIEDVPERQRVGLLKEVTEMEGMITQVIAFIRDASTPGPRERHDFADLVAASVQDARLIGSEVSFDAGPSVPVEVDAVGIRRLLGNLLENAVKYGDRAKVRVRIRDKQAVVEIVDDGPGVPEDEREHVFEPFYRSEAARRSGKPGSGLGLAVCRSIARAHGGDVNFVERPEGFVAILTVPMIFSGRVRQAA